MSEPQISSGSLSPSAAATEVTVVLAKGESAAPPERSSGALSSRFRILRPHAKGGLGQVSVALDQELNREVALKEIQPQYADELVSRERFLMEAEITGGLEHPGIVPVYALGHAADGRPYYAMRFVKGDSLRAASEAFHRADNPNRTNPGARQLALRHLLGRFIDVCNAMEYAHSRGVLHRDLKPGNIMIGKYGETLVVDWGLAKVAGAEEIVSDEPTLRTSSALSSSVQTQAGSAVGTPAYMSPEQAAGKLDELGPASDVYSLGATLYHLLCGKPPFEREAALLILEKVSQGRFPKPRTVVAEMPKALEAICVKAMALDAAKRYQSPRALADDLEHWLADEPVAALPETPSQRTARWFRRHRAWVQAAVIALLAITAISLTAAVLINESRHNEQLARLAAKENEQLAVRNAEAAERNEALAIAHEKTAAENAEAARRNSEEARQNAAVALANEKRAKLSAEAAERSAEAAKQQFRQTVTSMLSLGVQLEQRLKNRLGTAADPEAQALSQEALQVVSDNMAGMAKILQASGVTDFAMANIHDQMGDLFVKLGRGAEALQEFEDGRLVVQEVVAQRPEQDLARANLALFNMKIGKTHLDVYDDAQTGLTYFLKARELQREIMDHPQRGNFTPADHRRLVSRYEIPSGVAELRLGHPRPAREHFRAALDLRRGWLELSPDNVEAYSYISECYLWLGTVAWHLGDADGVDVNFGAGLRVCSELAGRFPKAVSFLGDLADVYGSFGDAQLRLGKTAEAGASYAKSLDSLRPVIAANGDDMGPQALLAQTLERQALLAETTGDAARAKTLYDEARALRDTLARLDPQNLSWQAARALTLAHCGRRAGCAEQVEALLGRAHESPGVRLQAARCFAVCSQGEPDPEKKRQFIERALASVTAAVADDFADVELLTTDPELAPLRSESEWDTIIGKLRERAAE